MKYAILVPLLLVTTMAQTPPPPFVGRTQTVTWEAPTTNTDASPLTDLDGFTIAMCAAGKDMNVPGTIALGRVRIEDETATSAVTVFSMVDGLQYEFWISAFDKAGNESQWTGPITRIHDGRIPSHVPVFDVK
jgi:hypothetical protein